MKLPVAVVSLAMLVFFFIGSAIIGDLLNETIDGKIKDTNNATTYFVIFGLINCMSGLAAAIAGLALWAKWDADATGTALSTGLIALFNGFAALGLAFKQWDLAGDVSDELNTAGTFTLFAFICQLVFLILVGKFAPGAPGGGGGSAGNAAAQSTNP